MDSWSLKKRSDDGICKHGLNGPNRLKIRSLSTSRVDTLKAEVELAKKLKEKLAQDFASTSANCKALSKDLTKCHDWGGPTYRHVPPSEMKPPEVFQARETMRNNSSNMSLQMDGMGRLHKEEKRDFISCKADTSISRMDAWFAKYGQPRRGSGPTFERRQPHDHERIAFEHNPESLRQAELGERQRTVPHRGRHVPFVGRTNAQPLRLGSGIWNIRSETELKGSWNFNTPLGPKRQPLSSTR
jgi:hypothetical protein